MSDLQRIRNGSPDMSECDDHRPVPGITSVAPNSGGIGNAADWRQRKAGRISKMERSNLQLALNNEIRERELAQQRVRELEVQLEETTMWAFLSVFLCCFLLRPVISPYFSTLSFSRLTGTSNKLLQTEKERETLRDQLVQGALFIPCPSPSTFKAASYATLFIKIWDISQTYNPASISHPLHERLSQCPFLCSAL